MEAYKNMLYRFYVWRSEANLVYKVILAFIFAGITGIFAQLKIYLPFTPVPITGQVFAVLLSSSVLGRHAFLSMLIYIALGVAGVPWFAGCRHGIEVLLGATGGYIVGFLLASLIVGYMLDSYVRARKLGNMLVVMFSGVAVIYLLGFLNLAFILGSFKEAFIKGVVPFIPGDILKVFAATAVSYAIIPKEMYNGELDARRPEIFRKAIVALGTISTAVVIAVFWIKLLTVEKASLSLIKVSTFYGAVILILSYITLKALKNYK